MKPSIRAVAALAAASVVFTSAACSSDSSENETIRVGTVPALYWAAWSATPDAVTESDSGVDIELIPFKSSADVLVALQTGDIQMATMGMNVAASGLANGDLPISMVAGVSPGRSQLLLREGSGIQTWDDMRGRNVGLIRGSTDELIFRVALAENGIDIDTDTNVTTMQSAADLLLALRNGDVDAVVTYQPNTAQAVQQGVATEPEDLNAELTEVASVPSDLFARNDLIESNPEAVQTIVDTFVEITDTFTDKETWVDTALQYQSGDRDLLIDALQSAEPWYRLEESEHVSVVQNMAKFGSIPADNSDQVVSMLNYDFLSEATGQSPEDLGKGQ